MANELESIARALCSATSSARPIPQPTRRLDLTVEDAYMVQRRLAQLRVSGGDEFSGIKLGFTNSQKAAKVGVWEPTIGHLHESMLIDQGAEVDLATYIRPRMEVELAFRLAVNLGYGERLVEPLAAIASVAPAIEIVDSRYEAFHFTVEDVIADNSSAAGYVLGAWRDMEIIGEVVDRKVSLDLNGKVVQVGTTSTILGNPLNAIGVVQRIARRYGVVVPASTLVLAALPDVPLVAGVSVHAMVQGMGGLQFHVASP